MLMAAPTPEANYINFRFKGGGGNYENRLLRVRLIERISSWAGFTVATRGDLLDAGFQRRPLAEILGRLTLLGILQGKCRLLDMALTEGAQIDEMVESFQAILGRISLSSTGKIIAERNDRHIVPDRLADRESRGGTGADVV